VTRTALSGWGRTSTSYADVISPNSESDIALALATSSEVIARGLGRSYGDAALLSGGVVL
jgi:decaprenylphospho-beta-D-ribofuranose 2-oxidase